MDDPSDFAEQYNRAERMRFVVIGAMAGAVAILAGNLWLFPGLRAFAASASCRTVLGIPGEVVLWHGVFVGIPLLAACVVASTVGRRGLRILRDGQVPPVGEKVLRPTRIRRGQRATLTGYLHVLAAAPLAMIVIWGVVQASEWSRHPERHSAARCVAGPQAANARAVPAPSPAAAR